MPNRRRRRWIMYGGALLLALWIAGVVGLASWQGSKERKDENKKDDRKGAATAALTVLGPGEPVPSGVNEPSGVAFHPRNKHLYVVGDEGSLAELDQSGKLVRSSPLAGNLEDVAVHVPSGLLLLLVEAGGELILYDPAARQEKKRWQLETEALLGEAPRQKGHGFEGIAFKDDPSSPGGGLVYLAHQREPATVVSLALDPEHAPGRLGADVVRDRFRLKQHEDLSAITYVPSLDRFVLIAESQDRLLVMRPDGRMQAEAALPGMQQEGLCFDAAGTLWVADDRAGRLMRFPGALGALTVGLKSLDQGKPGSKPAGQE